MAKEYKSSKRKNWLVLMKLIRTGEVDFDNCFTKETAPNWKNFKHDSFIGGSIYFVENEMSTPMLKTLLWFNSDNKIFIDEEEGFIKVTQK